MESHCLSEFTVMHSVRKWDISKAFALQISPNPAFFFFASLSAMLKLKRNLTSGQLPLQTVRMERGLKGCLQLLGTQRSSPCVTELPGSRVLSWLQSCWVPECR